MAHDSVALAQVLLRSGRVLEARDALVQAIAAGQDGAPVRSLLGLVLHQLGDLPGCQRELRQAVTLAPQDGAAQFALASIALRLGDEEEAEAAARRAVTLGMDDIHSYVLLGRLFNKQGRLEEAETAWRKAVRKDPSSPQAQRELAGLVWMRTGDLSRARAELDAAPQTPDIVAVTVRLLQDAGDEAGAYTLAAARADRDASLNVLAARAGLKFDPQDSDRRLSDAAPGITPQLRAKAEIEVDLALGRIEQAVKRAEALHAARPTDQHATALLAVAWRLAGDPRYASLYDYGRLVKAYRIEAPQGWSSLDDYLRDLGDALDAIHGPLTHPVGQSLRHGSQTMRALSDYPDPAIRALFDAIDEPIRAHIAALGEPNQDYGFGGAWSVRLNASGFHINHIHPEGWLSSAFYVRLPEKMEGREGWLKFGEPGPPTVPPLAPDHLVKPEPGLLVLFPSYMWHGTVPFASDDKRLSCAFDIVRRSFKDPGAGTG
ncbi:MAG: tetratricopeptide repeat protein [Alphaproteobacteria bacterium]|nr:tetratricopeptide repeat protein [Alphaproteobacteria bacterium]